MPTMVPVGANPLPSARVIDPLEKAIAFHAQSIERLIAARTLEQVAKAVNRGGRSWIVTAAEASTLAAANTLDAGNQELADTIRDLITTTIMAAVAAIPEPTK